MEAMPMIDFYRMRFLINRLPAARFRVDKAIARATKTTTVLTGMPRGTGTGNQVEDGAILIEYARQAMDNITTELEGMRAELTPLIESLESPLQKNAMWMRYIEGHSVREIAYSLNYSEQHIFRILQIAERKIQKNESCESS